MHIKPLPLTFIHTDRTTSLLQRKRPNTFFLDVKTVSDLDLDLAQLCKWAKTDFSVVIGSMMSSRRVVS